MEYEAVLEMVVAIARQSSESMGTGSMGRKSADLLEGLAMLTIADFDDSDLLSYFLTLLDLGSSFQFPAVRYCFALSNFLVFSSTQKDLCRYDTMPSNPSNLPSPSQAQPSPDLIASAPSVHPYPAAFQLIEPRHARI